MILPYTLRESMAAFRDRAQARWRREKILADPAARRLHDACAVVDAGQIRALPVAKSRFVALDLETTGPYPHLGDEIISVALVELRGLAFSGRQYTTLVNPERPIPPGSSAIHGILEADIRHSPPIAGILPELIDFLGNAVIIAHHANFDFRFLNKSLYRHGAIALKNPWIDTMMLYGAWRGKQRQCSLDKVAEKCSIPAHGRHDALRDARMAAEIVQFLAPRLLAGLSAEPSAEPSADPDETVGHLIEQQFHHEHF